MRSRLSTHNLIFLQKNIFSALLVLFWERWYNKIKLKRGDKMRSNSEIIDIIISEKEKQGISLSELARRIGIAKSAMSRYLNKTRQFPLNRVQEFAKVLNVTPEYLLGLDDFDNLLEKQIEERNELSSQLQIEYSKTIELITNYLLDLTNEMKEKNIDREYVLKTLQHIKELLNISDTFMEGMLKVEKQNSILQQLKNKNT